jgi:prepilin-type N-terminal cleavage/methylation domain-containing protein
MKVHVNPEKENCMSKLRQRLAREEGFTLIELLVVIVIIGILLAIAVPSYLGFKDRANQKAADADIRAAVPSAEAFYADHGNYSTLTPARIIASYDQGAKVDNVKVLGAAFDSYCIDKQVSNKKASITRGANPLTGTDNALGDVKEGTLC